MESIIEQIFKSLKNYSSIDGIEFEGRLGIYDHENKKFDSNIGEEYYINIQNMLDSFQNWNSKITTEIIDYFHNNARISVDNKTKQVIGCIEKKKISTFNYINDGLSLDFRVDISKEVPVKIPKKYENSKFKRVKYRQSYIFNNVSCDITKILQ